MPGLFSVVCHLSQNSAQERLGAISAYSVSRKEGFYWVLCSTMFSDTDTPKGLQHYTSLIAQRAKIHYPNEFFFPICALVFLDSWGVQVKDMKSRQGIC